MLTIVEFCFELVSGVARSVTARTAALDDKAGLDAVKRQAVVKPGARELDKRRDCARRIIGKKLEDDVAALRLDTDREVFRLGVDCCRFLGCRWRVSWHPCDLQCPKRLIWRRAIKAYAISIGVPRRSSRRFLVAAVAAAQHRAHVRRPARACALMQITQRPSSRARRRRLRVCSRQYDAMSDMHSI